ncbi:hypothetical protein HF086_017568 [Spodoptera exigua]|uniref:Uncharacterized protein n=1 Tax=Spodoptera exigua TaxID=7107 RepID=A0A922SSH4_SPOEX|nr:hypothetical protein HF086_017568 [Spodoptera exigua]
MEPNRKICAGCRKIIKNSEFLDCCELSEFKSSFGFFNEQFEDFKKRSDEKDAIIDQLCNDNAKLQHSVNDLTIRLCNAEQYMRESNVEISGLPEDKSEDLVKTLQLSRR